MRGSLTLHPDSACPAVTDIAVDVLSHGPRMLMFRYFATGAIEALLIPSPSAPARSDSLWNHTCFEAFIGGPSGYFEFNFSPSMQWAAYRFDGYRSGMREAGIAPPCIQTSSTPGRFELRAELTLPEDADGRLGLCAVIEDTSGTKSYWALAHPPGKPDFHDPTCFALDLPAAV